LELAVGLLGELSIGYLDWTAEMGEPGRLRTAYLERCTTVGRQVRVELPGGGSVDGTATTVDDQARLVVMTPGGTRAVGAGDVVHVR
jgi:BirA family biotin operon repressor/biotin-[acetyl-CoA-carboxylase] ligase